MITMSQPQDKDGNGSPHCTQLYMDIPSSCLPIVYSSLYNITFMGLEKLHPFDAGKWGKVIRFLKEDKIITDGRIVEAREATEDDLLVVHTKRYLSRLKWSLIVASITEIPPLVFLPNFLVQRRVLRPLRTQTGGTIMAGKLAVDRGWAINVGAIKRKVELDWGTQDEEYLQKVELHLEGALNEVRPDILVYNAGTDVLDGDPLGGLAISPQGIIRRDEVVFRAAQRRGIPILMVTSGGYQKKTARIIADSIINLRCQGLIGGNEDGEGSEGCVGGVSLMMCSASSSPSSVLKEHAPNTI
uniref:Histone deacetylase domain-containing protein n=1 Tax=Esox lucius TaxID=8010 RepID=A0AAY5KUE8_ESOLU